MFGDNPKRISEKGDGSTLQLQHIFATIQGEGPFSGTPAIFVRLGGCNLACDFCDTEFESFEPVALTDIIARVIKLAQTGGYPLVVITGGEPFRQPITPLCDTLLAAGFDVQIETNGTLWREVDSRVSIVCSPKNTGNGYQPVRPDVLGRTTALKFVISEDDAAYCDVPDVGQHIHNTPVYLQPMDAHDPEKNKVNRLYTSNLVQKHGLHLSLQLHKVIGLE